ncbi:MAG: hypothetical protein EON58_19325 [Alphaproteobacteria bacterium]|nr:MAG: hypothetical protein EON58_19325 [Alphaproteobacteria bacterium]
MSDLVPSTGQVQLELSLEVAVEQEINGVGMGVLSDGTPYLNIRGLAAMCGVDHSQIVRITNDWDAVPLKPREAKIRELVRVQGVDDHVAFQAVMRGGTVHHIVPGPVCMAILEYYAFEARGENDHAAASYRILARKGFNDYVYAQVGYNPDGTSKVAWKQFHDRVTLNYHQVPDGYFSVFKEIADITVTLIKQGVELGDKFIPDISVGMAWGKHWSSGNLDNVYDSRKKVPHYYPAHFPQALSNPQDAWVYPDEALPEFRSWVRKTYLPDKLPKYLSSKVADGSVGGLKAQQAIAVLVPKKLSASTATAAIK